MSGWKSVCRILLSALGYLWMAENQRASFLVPWGTYEWLKISVRLSYCPEVLMNGWKSVCVFLGVLRYSWVVENQCVSFSVSWGTCEWYVSLTWCPEELINGACLLPGVLRFSWMVENQCVSYLVSWGSHEWWKISVSLTWCPEVLMNGGKSVCLLPGVLKFSWMVENQCLLLGVLRQVWCNTHEWYV